MFFKTFKINIKPSSDLDDLITKEICKVIRENPDYYEADRQIVLTSYVPEERHAVVLAVVTCRFDVR